MHKVNKKYDLNLLRVFQAITETGSISRAANRLALSQPAVSHALNRLREQLGDPLFLRNQGQLTLTPRAMAITHEVQSALLITENIFGSIVFDPTQIKHVRIGVSDYALHTFGPGLLRHLASHSPDVSVEFIANDKQTLAKLAKHDLDLACWGDREVPDNYSSRYILDEHYVCAIPDNHPSATADAITLDQYLESTHVIFSDGAPGTSSVSIWLEQQGLDRRILASSNNFLGNMSLAVAANAIISLPSQLAHLVPAGMVVRPLPFELPSFPYGVIWSSHRDRDGLISWIVDYLVTSRQ
jgi:DNA-binding transcriptional LysR family regulator